MKKLLHQPLFLFSFLFFPLLLVKYIPSSIENIILIYSIITIYPIIIIIFIIISIIKLISKYHLNLLTGWQYIAIIIIAVWLLWQLFNFLFGVDDHMPLSTPIFLL